MIDTPVSVEYRGRIAILTLNNPKQLNAMTNDQFFQIGQLLNEIATRDEVVITILAAKGRFFSAGANISSQMPLPSDTEHYLPFLKTVTTTVPNTTRAFAHHPKILIAALHGPAVGLVAVLASYADFIYASPHTYLLTPFTSLGLVAEGGASHAFVRRMGIAKANEALLMSRRIGAEELRACGFVNKVLEVQTGEDERFLALVLKEVEERLGPHLVKESLVRIKALIRKAEWESADGQNLAELIQTTEVYNRGIPQAEFRKMASGQKRHKL